MRRDVGRRRKCQNSARRPRIAVTFKELDSAAIDEYIANVNVLDKAGSYAAQEFGSMIIEKIDGAFDNVMGLPVNLAKKILDRLVSISQSL